MFTLLLRRISPAKATYLKLDLKGLMTCCVRKYAPIPNHGNSSSRFWLQTHNLLPHDAIGAKNGLMWLMLIKKWQIFTNSSPKWRIRSFSQYSKLNSVPFRIG